MDFIKKYNLTLPNIAKITGLLFLVFVVLTITTHFSGSSMEREYGNGVGGFGTQEQSVSPRYSGATSDMYYEDESSDYSLSKRNIAISPEPSYINTNTSGDDAEEFEVTEYYGSINTPDVKRTCETISDLKPREYVIFEGAREYDKGCHYVFKVTHEHAGEILAIIEGLNPDELTENTKTIKNQIEDYTSRLDILENKLVSIDATLESTVTAYDELTTLATQSQDAENLTKIIGSKLTMIERLTNERINIASSIESIKRSQARELDRLAYTFFSIDVYENKFVDVEAIQDSWKNAMQNFVFESNQIVQGITVGFIIFLLLIAKYLIYFFVIFFTIRFSWKIVRRTWNT